MDGQGTKWRRKIAENFKRLSRVHERYRQTTDGRAIAYSERERELTFAKNQKGLYTLNAAARPVSGRGRRDHAMNHDVTPLPRNLHWLPLGQRVMFNSVFDFIFPLFFVSGPCARLSWPSRPLLSAR